MTKNTSIKTKNITLDDLAEMLAKQFLIIDKRFDAIDLRFEAIDLRFESIDQRFDLVDKRFDLVDQRLSGLQNQLDNIYLNYVRRPEHLILQERVRKVERKVGIKYDPK